MAEEIVIYRNIDALRSMGIGIERCTHNREWYNLIDRTFESSKIRLLIQKVILRQKMFMERKGSGFGKIISGYEFQINYNESKRPSFRSDRYQFTVVMPDLNYDVPQDKLDIQIMDLVHKDSKISAEKMAIALGVSSKTIKRHIKEMDNVNYIGRGFSGHWEITDNK